jgi:ribose/xylose/arabinose/galactoside ABC-type transport system permease subunit
MSDKLGSGSPAAALTTGLEARRKRRSTTALKIYAMEAILLVMVVVLMLTAPGFATIGNLLNVLRTGSMLGIVAFGMTAVIISGEIDLSVGAGVALAGCIIAWFSQTLETSIGYPLAVAIGAVAALAVGGITGIFTGKMRQWFNVPTFITTLALFTALRGLANLISGGFPLTDLPPWFSFLGAGDLFGIPFPVYVFLAVFLGMQFLMKYTSYGREVYAVGGNAEAARLSGISVFGVKTIALAITGVLTAISGILIASQIGSGTGTTATGMELDVIAATIIGGTSLFGGKGRIWGTLLGVLFLGCVTNGMTLLNVSEYWQYVVRGAIILGAVLMNQVLERIR